MTENIVTGKKYRILTDAANDIWDRISFWSKASDVQYDDNTTAEANKAVAILKRNASYTVGTVAYEPSAPSWVLLKCTQAGTTAAVIPSTYSTISSVGTVITDGTARFTVYDVRPSGTLSNSEYQVPAMSLVNGLDAELTANGNKFYFDYKNSKYGYNTSASRAAATFVPFGGTNTYSVITGTVNMTGNGTSYVGTATAAKGYSSLALITVPYSFPGDSGASYNGWTYSTGFNSSTGVVTYTPTAGRGISCYGNTYSSKYVAWKKN